MKKILVEFDNNAGFEAALEIMEFLRQRPEICVKIIDTDIDEETGTDIIDDKPKFVRWINQYLNPGDCGSYPTRTEADSCAASDRIACIRIVFEEGEGL